MKKMKRILAFVMAVLLVLSFFNIGNDPGKVNASQDNEGQVISDAKITYNDEEEYVEFSAKIKDVQSGIKTIQYEINPDDLESVESSQKFEYGENSNAIYTEGDNSQPFQINKEPDAENLVKIKINYDDLNDNYNNIIKFVVTNNSGKVLVQNSKDSKYETYISKKAALITIDDITINSKEDTARGFDAIHTNVCGDQLTIMKEAFTIKATVKVNAANNGNNSAIKVELCDDAGNILKDDSTNTKTQQSDAIEVSFDIDDEICVDNLSIKVTDSENHIIIQKISDAIKELKNKLVFEKNPATITANYDNCELDAYNNYWINKKGGNFTVNIGDEQSGISEYTISQLYWATADEEANDTEQSNWKIIKNQVIDTYETQVTEDLNTEVDGIYEYKIEVTDNSGNSNTEKFKLCVDKSDPKVNVEISAGETQIGNTKWCDAKGKMSLNLSFEASQSPVKNISLKINGKRVEEFDEENIDYRKLTKGSYSIEAFDINKYINESDNNYEIEAEITSESGNSNSSKKECFVDKSNPTISKIQVINNANKAEDVTTLGSGVYSNSNITLKVNAIDAEGETGIDKVIVRYLKNNKQEEKSANAKSADGTYDFILEAPDNGEVCYENIEVIAYDKIGHCSTETPNIQNIAGKESGTNFVMQEKVVPKLKVELPETDSQNSKCHQIWYNKNHSFTVAVADEESGIKDAAIYVNNVLLENTDFMPDLLETAIEYDSQGNQKKITYKLDTENICKYLEQMKHSPEDGKYNLKIQVSDNANNMVIDNTSSFSIDTEAPVINEISFSRQTADGIESVKEFTDDSDYKYFFNDTFSLSVKVSDGKISCGLNKISYKLVYDQNDNNGKIMNGTSDIHDGVATIEIPKGFKGRVFVKACDFADNSSNEVTTAGFVVDESDPEITVSSIKDTDQKDKNGNKIFANDVNFKVTVSDTVSGIKKITASVNSDSGNTSTLTEMDASKTYKVGDLLDDGWVVTAIDRNLVTEVTKQYNITEDVNDFSAEFVSTDKSNNNSETAKSETFTIDKTAPVIDVTFPEGLESDPTLYNKDKPAQIDITVYERNFDADLITAEIENTYNENIPSLTFSATDKPYVYTASLKFQEGDYNVALSGTDLAGNNAVIKYNNSDMTSFRTMFSVDETEPVISTNFSAFTGADNTEGQNFFHETKEAVITCTEHNFDSESMDVKVYEKMPGESFEMSQENETSYIVYSAEGWVDDADNPDVHILDMKFSEDGIYKIEVNPKDKAENAGAGEQTAVFEIDTTAPVIVSRNEEVVEPDDTSELEIYSFENKDDAAPKLEFDDVNFDHLEYAITKFTPQYNGEREISEVTGRLTSGEKNTKEFTLPEFDKDGVYSVDVVAVDKAGNRSTVVQDTYMRMINTDVLAYIEDSHPAIDGNKGTGWYSIEDEDGPLSKRPDTFDDLKIAVFTKATAQAMVTLNSNDGDNIDVETQQDENGVAHGVNLCRYTVSGNFFKDTFREDTDAEYYLTVSTLGESIELGEIHIDNIAPQCKLPGYFHDWGWMRGEKPEPITITDINEKIDTDLTKVYVDGKEVDSTYDSKANTLSFDISKGNHSVGVSLVDTAGNAYDIPEITNLYVGNLRLYVGIGMFIVGSTSLFIIFRKRKKAKK